MPDEHALLSASSSKRWLNCTPSARIEAALPESTSDFAEEGTAAHALAEAILKGFAANGSIAGPEALGIHGADPEMLGYVMDYVNAVANAFREADRMSGGQAKLFVEQRVDYGRYAPGGFGTSDSVIVSPGNIEIFDLKYGRGVAVDAKGNTQLRLYALGAIEENAWLYPLNFVTYHIVQPRLYSHTQETVPVVQLQEWGESYVRPRAEQAARGCGDFKPGEWCKFCKIGATCKHRAFDLLESFYKVLNKAGGKKDADR